MEVRAWIKEGKWRIQGGGMGGREEGSQEGERNKKDISRVKTKKGVRQSKTGLTLWFVSLIGSCVLSGHGRCHEPRTEQGDQGQALCSHHDAQFLPGERAVWVGWPPCMPFSASSEPRELWAWVFRVHVGSRRCFWKEEDVPGKGGQMGCCEGAMIRLGDDWTTQLSKSGRWQAPR